MELHGCSRVATCHGWPTPSPLSMTMESPIRSSAGHPSGLTLYVDSVLGSTSRIGAEENGIEIRSPRLQTHKDRT